MHEWLEPSTRRAAALLFIRLRHMCLQLMMRALGGSFGRRREDTARYLSLAPVLALFGLSRGVFLYFVALVGSFFLFTFIL